jgi:hypothetical protein
VVSASYGIGLSGRHFRGVRIVSDHLPAINIELAVAALFFAPHSPAWFPAVRGAGLSTLNEGQQIEYEIEENRGKTSAVNLKVK